MEKSIHVPWLDHWIGRVAISALGSVGTVCWNGVDRSSKARLAITKQSIKVSKHFIITSNLFGQFDLSTGLNLGNGR